MITVTINGEARKVLKGVTVLQALYENNIEVPRFCYHEGLQIAGNCRMCLVEVEKSLKPVASCATAVMDGMSIKTNTDMVRKAREGVMELLLVNHPLDCPICDQGGECDLQDQAMLFGNDRGRNLDYKRSVEDKNLGPLVKTVMTRCIHCTRCIRYITDVVGIDVLGSTSRGNHMEIGTFLEKALVHELSGNVIDLCPVGALTSKPYAFTARSWELQSTESIDIFDGLGSHIRIDTRGTEVMRIQPKIKKGLNNEWISDTVRFCYDGLRSQRLTKPMKKVATSGTQTRSELKTTTNVHYIQITWKEALDAIRQNVSSKTSEYSAGKKSKLRRAVHIRCGSLVDAETIFSAQKFASLVGSSSSMQLSNDDATAGIRVDLREECLTPVSISGFNDFTNLLFFNIHPRHDAAVLNVSLRQAAQLQKDPSKRTNIFLFGPRAAELTYIHNHLGTTTRNSICRLLDGRHPLVQFLFRTKSLLMLRPDSQSHWLFESFHLLKEFFSGFAGQIKKDSAFVKNLFRWHHGYFHINASSPTALELGTVFEKKPINSLYRAKATAEETLQYLIGESSVNLPSSAFTVYQGHHGESAFARASSFVYGHLESSKDFHRTAISPDVLLPSCSFVEKGGLYVNTEGRVQEAKRAVDVKGLLRQDWEIIRAVSSVTLTDEHSHRSAFPYKNQFDIRRAISFLNPAFSTFS